ncbi:protein of unknown function [Chitinophaga costaii]|uniref:DarT domain-containing protein n=1 Tax=Chitinophaga costaii TaxID=1335309 RepID=A0A1C4E3X9_9BACT|nr:DUF4433 domain-containing protein [Chitinophaga costaii]SCC38260.1 protein of unknown function [Chitinophaga costaii]
MELIANRHNYPVKINPPNGTLGEYVPFYFGHLSPMLLKIKNGTQGITQRSQRDIVYVICKVESIVQLCENWCFTDGHAKNAITEFYNNLSDLDKIDWDIVFEKYWGNKDDDFDRMRRKQAEFLIKNHVLVGCIDAVATINESSKAVIEGIMLKLRLTIPVMVNPNLYY